MNLAFRLYQIRTVGWRVSAAKLGRALKKRMRGALGNTLPAHAPKNSATFLPSIPDSLHIVLPKLGGPSAPVLAPFSAELQEHATRYADGELWLSGTGWKSFTHGAPCPGMENYRYNHNAEPLHIDAGGEWMQRLINSANVQEAQRRWLCIRQPYTALDWQCDHRSGYTWSEGVASSDTRISPQPGVDPKNPWDLARMHHAVHLAMASVACSDPARKTQYAELFRSRVLDFLSTNPPGYGINWTVPMEASIRIANVLVGYHVFCADGALFDTEFSDSLRASVVEHAEWILERYEWSEGMRGNHFLSNIAGLSACAAFMSPCHLRDRIDLFVQKHLDAELFYQFHSDGSHFEASLPYHCFSAEMIAWSYLFAASRDSSFTVSDQVRSRLRAVHEFTAHILGAGGMVPQIGDNDGGHFIPLLPFYQTPEQPQRPHHRREAEVLCGLAAHIGHVEIRTLWDDILLAVAADAMHGNAAESAASPVSESPSSTLSNSSSNNADTIFSAADFGISLRRTHNYACYLRAGSVGQHGRGGHSHNDQLSVVLSVHGKEFFCDPGTYVYTALPLKRNTFRTTSMHNTLNVGTREQSRLPQDLREGLFWIQSNTSKATILQADTHTWKGRHSAFGPDHTRTVHFHNQGIVIEDHCDTQDDKVIYMICHPDVHVELIGPAHARCSRGATVVDLHGTGPVVRIDEVLYSPEYGVCVPTRRLAFSMDKAQHELRCIIAEK